MKDSDKKHLKNASLLMALEKMATYRAINRLLDSIEKLTQPYREHDPTLKKIYDAVSRVYALGYIERFTEEVFGFNAEEFNQRWVDDLFEMEGEARGVPHTEEMKEHDEVPIEDPLAVYSRLRGSPSELKEDPMREFAEALIWSDHCTYAEQSWPEEDGLQNCWNAGEFEGGSPCTWCKAMVVVESDKHPSKFEHPKNYA